MVPKLTLKKLDFEFDFKKFIAVLNYLVKACEAPMTKLKIAKLLYLLDRRHFNLHARPVLGDTYFRLDYGPVPSQSLDLLDELTEAQGAKWAKGESKVLSKYFAVKSTGKHPTISAKEDPPLNVLSKTELEALQWVARNFGKKSAGALVDITHTHATWKETAPVKEIDYRLFPKGDPEAVVNIAEIAVLENEERAELLHAMSRGTVSSVA